MKRCENVLLNPEEKDTNYAYTALILEQTDTEAAWNEQVLNDANLSNSQKTAELHKQEEYFYYRRIINAEYFM